MFDYFRNYSNNTHHVCCEDSQAKSLCMTIVSPMTLLFTQGLKHDKSLTYIRQYLSCDFQTWHDGRRMHSICAHTRFDDLDLDARLQWVSKGKTYVLNYFDN